MAQILLNFYPNLIISLLAGAKPLKDNQKNISSKYLSKMDHPSAKNLNRVTDNIEILQTNSFGCVFEEKKLKIIFLSVTLFIVKMGSEI